MTAKRITMSSVPCLAPKCGKQFVPKRRHQKFCSPKCRFAAFEVERGTRDRWRETAESLADVLRTCVASGALPAAVERRASAALVKAMPYRTRKDPATIQRRAS